MLRPIQTLVVTFWQQVVVRRKVDSSQPVAHKVSLVRHWFWLASCYDLIARLRFGMFFYYAQLPRLHTSPVPSVYQGDSFILPHHDLDASQLATGGIAFRLRGVTGCSMKPEHRF